MCVMVGYLHQMHFTVTVMHKNSTEKLPVLHNNFEVHLQADAGGDGNDALIQVL